MLFQLVAFFLLELFLARLFRLFLVPLGFFGLLALGLVLGLLGFQLALLLQLGLLLLALLQGDLGVALRL